MNFSLDKKRETRGVRPSIAGGRAGRGGPSAQPSCVQWSTQSQPSCLLPAGGRTDTPSCWRRIERKGVFCATRADGPTNCNSATAWEVVSSLAVLCISRPREKAARRAQVTNWLSLGGLKRGALRRARRFSSEVWSETGGVFTGCFDAGRRAAATKRRQRPRRLGRLLFPGFLFL